MEMFESLSLQSLISAALRITPASDTHKWVITDGSWVIGNEEMCMYYKGEIIDRMSFDDMREYLIEHLNHYGITTRQINSMQS